MRGIEGGPEPAPALSATHRNASRAGAAASRARAVPGCARTCRRPLRHHAATPSRSPYVSFAVENISTTRRSYRPVGIRYRQI